MADTPVVHVISDSLGDTAASVVAAALSQFPHENITIGRLSKVSSLAQVIDYLDKNYQQGSPLVLFHTIANTSFRNELIAYASKESFMEVDLLGPAIAALSKAFNMESSELPGVIHETDDDYYRRIDAMEYTVNHDDGRQADDLTDADIVLIGVSRTSKTPLSLLLAMRGFKVANIPLANDLEPPAALFQVPRHKIFGLMSSVSVLSEIRYRRLGNAQQVAHSYANPSLIQSELDTARALMRRLGCIVLRTDNRAIEETASDIEHYLLGAL